MIEVAVKVITDLEINIQHLHRLLFWIKTRIISMIKRQVRIRVNLEMQVKAKYPLHPIQIQQIKSSLYKIISLICCKMTIKTTKMI